MAKKTPFSEDTGSRYPSREASSLCESCQTPPSQTLENAIEHENAEALASMSPVTEKDGIACGIGNP